MAFTYAAGRSGQYADNILKGCSSPLKWDVYAGYNRVLKRPGQDVVLGLCPVQSARCHPAWHSPGTRRTACAKSRCAPVLSHRSGRP
ncbi:IS66 family transposase [Thalassobacter stenotrophicus]|uniref:IS66 family transposase n=1 Tax=Thalassobacter stenotrophicus TaxID=266809 RepID=UPI0022A91423|nr:transposase [Thalassobacter stenotrophicus]UYP67826.1 IS66 family transposase [Thalassobacter stenotrophicus]